MLWAVLRLALCAGALVYVFSRAEVTDVTWLEGADSPVPIVSMDAQQAQIIVDGQMQTVPVESLQQAEGGSPRVRPGLRSLWQRSDKRLLLLALGLYGLHPLLMMVRFGWILRLQRARRSWLQTGAICWIGNFYSFVIPGTTGGDVVRAAYLMRQGTGAHGAIVALGLDRLTGLAGLLGMAAVVGLVLPVDAPAVRHAAWTSAALLAVLIGGFLAATAYGRLGHWLRRLPLGRHLQELYDGVRAGRAGWATLVAAIGVTVLLQAAAMGAYSIAAVALGMAPAWQQYFVCLPIAMVVASVPIVPMGLGTLEATMILLLTPTAGSASQVLALALAMRVLNLSWALPGGLVPAFWSVRRHEQGEAVPPGGIPVAVGAGAGTARELAQQKRATDA